MTTTTQLMKNLCGTPGVASFSAKFLELIELFHKEKGSCFLCNNIFKTDPALKKIENSSWSQLFPFLKKAGIPICIVGLARLVKPAMEKNHFNYDVTRKMESYDLCHILCGIISGGVGTYMASWMHLCEQNYNSFDIEKILLEILDEFHEVFEDNVRRDTVPSFQTIEKTLVEKYELPRLPVELTSKMYFQSAIICGFLDLESMR